MEWADLTLRWKKLLPAIQARIDGPGARSDHRQADGHACQYDRQGLGSGLRDSDPRLQHACQHSRYGGPQACQDQEAGGSAEDL